jgi:hypothetical protein
MDKLESSKLAVLVRDFSLCFTFCDGNVARELGVYFTVEARNDTWRQRAHSEVCVVLAWRASTVLA